MPTAVFSIVPAFGLQQSLMTDDYIADQGDGFEQRVNFNQAYTRADGEGGVTSYKGRNQFTMKFNAKDYATEANSLWNFFKARTGRLQSFYFYNPDEHAIDLTGATTTGRYLVRFTDAMMTREKFTRKLENVGISMIEVRA